MPIIPRMIKAAPTAMPAIAPAARLESEELDGDDVVDDEEEAVDVMGKSSVRWTSWIMGAWMV